MNEKIRILLVDDDVRSSVWLKRFIESEGYEVCYAVNGTDGLTMFREQTFDLILLDVNMPGMNGFELAKQIRATNTKVVIFFLTDRTERADRLYGFSIKGNDYIPKPFYPEELIARIKERFDCPTELPKQYVVADTVFRANLCSLSYNGVTKSLSVRQSEILQMLMAAPGTMVERDDILRKVWGDASYANSLALNVQITYLRRLIDDPRLSITSIKKKGYILTST
jgi:DNA-binding response OmpR family regulator